jgi:hypothetical protein
MGPACADLAHLAHTVKAEASRHGEEAIMKRLAISILAVILITALAAAEAYARGGRGGSHGRGFHGHHGHAHHGHSHRHHGHFHRGHAFHPRTHVFVGIGAPLAFGPWWYSAPYYAYPPIGAATYAPAYIEQDDVGTGEPPQSWWYYCPNSQTYFPYVKECAGGWERVTPVPSSSP